MSVVTISSKFQVVIPKVIRENMSLKIGQQFQLIQYGDRLEFLPLRAPKELRGFLQGMDTEIVREKDRI